VKHVGYLQLDPTNSIARNHLLVLWSRLGRYDEAALERLRWETRELFEYSAAIVPTEDFPIHKVSMRRYPDAYNWSVAIHKWLRDNASLHRSVMAQLRRHGPMPSRDLKFKADRSWVSTGWTNDRNVSRLLEIVHAQGKVVVAGRSGQQRLWDVVDRWLPTENSRISVEEAERRVMQRSARNLGVATAAELKREFFPGYPWPGLERAIDSLVEDKRLTPVTIEGLKGQRFAHTDSLAPTRRRTYTTFLSPFDPLLRDRKRTLALWDFFLRLEIYVPKPKRQFGYFVLPILHGDDLVGRIDPVFDRKTGVLDVLNVWWEPGRKEVPLDKPLRSLAAFVGAESIRT
jgi:uncharacterized protein